MRLFDLSHTIEPGMPLFSPQAPQPEVNAWMSHAASAASRRYEDCTCEISQVTLLGSGGTYLDSPYHFHPDKASVEALRLEQLVLPGVRVDCTGAQPRQPIGPDTLQGLDLDGKAVLFHTGWSRFWGSPDYFDFPFLTAACAQALASQGARLVGIDTLVIDDTTNPRRPVHVTLLGNDILIVENLTGLEALPALGFTFHAAPVKVRGASAFPVRAYAVII